MKSSPDTYSLDGLKVAALEIIRKNPGLAKMLLAGGAGLLGGGLVGGGIGSYLAHRAEERALKNKLIDAGIQVAQGAAPALASYVLRPPEPTLTDRLADLVRATTKSEGG